SLTPRLRIPFSVLLPGVAMRPILIAALCLGVAVDSLAIAATATVPSPKSGATRPGTGTKPGSKVFRLEHLLTLNSFSDLAWSRDGKKLAFVVTSVDTAENEYNPDLWLWDAAASAPMRLTRHPKPDVSPTFSPGGDTIAFVSTRATGEEAKPAIYMMSLQGGEPWAFGSYDEAVGE